MSRLLTEFWSWGSAAEPPKWLHQRGGRDKAALEFDGRRSDEAQKCWEAAGGSPKTDISHFLWTLCPILTPFILLLTHVSADRIGFRRRTASSMGQDCSMYTSLKSEAYIFWCFNPWPNKLQNVLYTKYQLMMQTYFLATLCPLNTTTSK